MSAVIETPIPVQTLTGNFNGQTLKLRQITVEEYDAMIESGVFDENDQVELLNGAIVEKMPKGTKHATLNDIIATHFINRLGGKVCVKNQTKAAQKNKAMSYGNCNMMFTHFCMKAYVNYFPF